MRNLMYRNCIYRAIVLLVVGVVALPTMAATEQQSRLKVMFEAANELCPIRLGMIGSLKGMHYAEDGNEVVAAVELSNAGSRGLSGQHDDSLMKRQLFLSMSAPNAKPTWTAVADAGASVKYIYFFTDGRTLEVSLTPDEVRHAVENDMSEKEKSRIQASISIMMENASCPSGSAGLVLKSVKEKDGEVLYLLDVDESLHNIDLFQSKVAELRGNVERIYRTDISVRSQLKYFVGAGLGVHYIYRGTVSGREVDVVFTVDDLADILGLLRSSAPSMKI